jgi:uncharacterized membrane protein
MLAFLVYGDWAIAWLMGSKVSAEIMLPQLGASILVYPLAARVVYALDRRRLGR